MREVKKNWLEPADGLKKKKKISDRTRVAFYQAPRLNKPHVYQNSTG